MSHLNIQSSSQHLAMAEQTSLGGQKQDKGSSEMASLVLARQQPSLQFIFCCPHSWKQELIFFPFIFSSDGPETELFKKAYGIKTFLAAAGIKPLPSLCFGSSDDRGTTVSAYIQRTALVRCIFVKRHFKNILLRYYVVGKGESDPH